MTGGTPPNARASLTPPKGPSTAGSPLCHVLRRLSCDPPPAWSPHCLDSLASAESPPFFDSIDGPSLLLDSPTDANFPSSASETCIASSHSGKEQAESLCSKTPTSPSEVRFRHWHLPMSSHRLISPMQRLSVHLDDGDATFKRASRLLAIASWLSDLESPVEQSFPGNASRRESRARAQTSGAGETMTIHEDEREDWPDESDPVQAGVSSMEPRASVFDRASAFLAACDVQAAQEHLGDPSNAAAASLSQTSKIPMDISAGEQSGATALARPTHRATASVQVAREAVRHARSNSTPIAPNPRLHKVAIEPAVRFEPFRRRTRRRLTVASWATTTPTLATPSQAQPSLAPTRQARPDLIPSGRLAPRCDPSILICTMPAAVSAHEPRASAVSPSVTVLATPPRPSTPHAGRRVGKAFPALSALTSSSRTALAHGTSLKWKRPRTLRRFKGRRNRNRP